MMLALALGIVSAALAAGFADAVAGWMSADLEVRQAARVYLEVRLLGFPAALVMFAAFGALRGLQEMKTPMWIAGGMSVANIGLDVVLIFGWGPVPALGIAGAAWATVASQILAAGVACWVVVARLGWTWRVEAREVGSLVVVGRDMVIRTSALLVFMLIATRVALQMGPAAGAAHQAIRQIWMLLAFLLDAYAASTQSLVAWFLGAARADLARRVAAVGMGWALVTGCVLSAVLWANESAVAALLVPPEARAVFASAWPVFVLSQPVNAVSFLTDGIHWGSSDFGWLRNGMLASSAVGLALLWQLDVSTSALGSVWMITLVWIAIRSVFGVVRIWPGLGRAPLASVSLNSP
jgi:MATE family multidrug resistance protein